MKPKRVAFAASQRVGRGRAEVELGAEPVQRLARRRDPLRIGMPGEQHRLLCVAAPRARDAQRHAVGTRRGLHPVERQRDVGPHRLALADLERASVLAGADGRVDRRGRRRRELRLGGPRDRYLVVARGDRIADRHTDAHRRHRVLVRERHPDVREAVAPSRRERGGPATREVLGELQVPWVRATGERGRLEEPVEAVVHRSRTGQRREVRRTAALVGGTDAARRRAEHHGPDDDGEQERQHEDRRLPVLCAQVDRRARAEGRHPPGEPGRHRAPRRPDTVGCEPRLGERCDALLPRVRHQDVVLRAQHRVHRCVPRPGHHQHGRAGRRRKCPARGRGVLDRDEHEPAARGGVEPARDERPGETAGRTGRRHRGTRTSPRRTP